MSRSAVPDAQSAQSVAVVAPTDPENVPTSHAIQSEGAEFPEAAAYVPAPQGTHGVDALLSTSFVPAAHCIHDVAPTAE